MSVPKSEHKVYIYKNDYNALCTEVYMRQNIETGGNLFGLWKNFGSAVIHVVLGPGQHCRRTSTSFQQDVEYMERVGRFVNDRYSLCHIGEWRSHHSLSLNKPSAEEEHNIRRIFPQGMSKFLVIIANIRNRDTIKLSLYFFTDGGTRYEKAEYVVLDSDCTFSTDAKISAEIQLGAEENEYQREIDTGNRQNVDSNFQRDGNAKPKRNLVVLSPSTSKPNPRSSTSKPNPSSFTSKPNQKSSTSKPNPRSSTSKPNPRSPDASSLVGQPTSAPKPKPRSSDALVSLTTSKSKHNPSSSDSLVNQSKPKAHLSDSSNTQVNLRIPPSTANPSLIKPHSPDTSACPSTPDSQDGNINPTRLQARQSSSLFGQPTLAPKPKPRSSDALVSVTTSKSKPNPSSSDSLFNQNKPKAHLSDSSNTQVNLSIPPSTANPSLVKPTDTSASPSTPDSQDNPGGSTPDGHEEPMDTEDSDLHPPRDYDESSASTSHPPTSQHDTSTEGQDDPEKKMNVDKKTPSEREIILKTIHDHLNYWFGIQTESMFKFETSKNSRDVIEISFKHNKKFWVVLFPEDFPIRPAELFSSRYQENVRLTKVYKTDIVKPLNNDVNILLSIKNRCNSSKCDVCKHFTRESLSQFNFSLQLMEKLVASACKLEDDITRSLSDVNDLKVNCCSDSQAQITFKHGSCFWIIDVPADFPDVPADVYYRVLVGSSQKHDAMLRGHSNGLPQALNTSELITKAIHMTCVCTPCFNARQQYQ